MQWKSLAILGAFTLAAACAADRDLPTDPSPKGPSFAIYSPGTITVQPTSTANQFTEGWFGYGDRLTAVGAASVGAFPTSQVLGNGSLRMTNSAFGWEVAAYGTPAVAPATLLSDVTELAYSSFTPSGQSGITIQHIALQFTIDYDLDDAYEGFQGRLVYEPYHCNSPVQDTWQTWNTLASPGTGCWWQTADPTNAARAPYVADVQQAGALPCPQANPCTWSEVSTAYPSAGFHRTNLAAGLILKIGSAWQGTFYTDALVVGVGGTTTTYDFEPATPCTTTCYVNATTGDDAFGGDTPGTAKRTIQAAVSQVSVGGTVIVAAGTYNEDVVVTTSDIELLGAGVDISTIVGPKGNARLTTLEVPASATGVMIDGFTITREGNNLADWNNANGALNNQGVAIYAAGTTLQNSRVVGNRNGIYLRAINVTLQYNDIDFNRTGIHAVNDVSGLLVQNNFITDNWTMGILFRNEVPLVTNLTGMATITNNDISGNWFSQIEARSQFVAPALNITGNWLGTTAPSEFVGPAVNEASASAEPGYAGQIPVTYGGTAVAPPASPTIAYNGLNATNPLDYVPFLCSGVDGSADLGFQPSGGLSSASGSCDFTAPLVTNVAVSPNPAPYTTASYTLTATATDDVAVTSASYTINGVGPTAFSFTAGSPVALTATFGPLAVGVHELCVTAKDVADNTSNTECTMLAVYDPTAGFVTGGGWFMSPAGAYVADAGLTGKATFGFVSKYVKGKTLPTGNTEFQFQAGGLNFSSTVYEWLVVNQAGMNAQFKGEGTLNGVPGHEFMVWARDGSPDSFRIQITDGSGTVVYDNHQSGTFGTPLGGGSIMIHIPKK